MSSTDRDRQSLCYDSNEIYKDIYINWICEKRGGNHKQNIM